MQSLKKIQLECATATKVRILIADDQELLRDALQRLLEKQPDFEVVGSVRNGRELNDMLDRLKPDVLLLDTRLNRESGFEILRALDGLAGVVRVIMLAASIEYEQVVEALRLGARGVVTKDSASTLLYKSIRSVMSGEYWVDHRSVAELVRALRIVPEPVRDGESNAPHGLTFRELEILKTIVDGCTNKDIALRFSISEQTVKHHLTNIYGKMGVSNRLELALVAMNRRIVSS